MIKIGDRVHALKMPEDSNNHQIIGEVVNLSSGYVGIRVESAISKVADDGRFYHVGGNIVDVAKIKHVLKK